MKNMEKQKFEQEWKEAFDQAEVSPSDNLWTNIELSLEKAEGDKMKSRLFFYKLTAAASIVFALFIAGAWVYYFNTTNSNLTDSPLAATENSSEIQKNRNNQVDATINDNRIGKDNPTEKNDAEDTEIRNDAEKQNISVPSSQNYNNPSKMLESSKNSTAQALNSNTSDHLSNRKSFAQNAVASGKLNETENIRNNFIAESNKAEAFAVVRNNEKNHKSSFVADSKKEEQRDATIPVQLKLNARDMPPLAKNKKITIAWPAQDPVAIMMAKLEQRERELSDDGEKKQRKKDKHPDDKNERLWTSLGFSAGSFGVINSATSTSSSLAASSGSASNNIAANQSRASGTSYTMGMNVGTRLSSRWILQGGVNYLSQNSAYEANAGAANSNANNQSLQAVSLNSFSSKSSQFPASLTASTSYAVDNNVRFVSVPVQAGYMMVNHAVGVQLNGGVSTDLFLQNTITPQSSGASQVTQTNGDGSSPYRTVNFSGLLGTEISYRFSRHYRLALNPGLRYPLNSIYKSDVGVNANPLTLDIGMRFRYIFH